jgi:hypothetical protein
VAKTLEQLERERQQIDEQIKEVKRVNREAKKALAIKTLEAAGLLELSDKELIEMLKSLKRNEMKVEVKAQVQDA